MKQNASREASTAHDEEVKPSADASSKNAGITSSQDIQTSGTDAGNTPAHNPSAQSEAPGSSPSSERSYNSLFDEK
jgi:hypothetical protein